MIIKKLYKCEYCGYTGRVYVIMAAHELKCIFNPSVKSCVTCAKSQSDECPFNEDRAINGARKDCECHVVNPKKRINVRR